MEIQEIKDLISNNEIQRSFKALLNRASGSQHENGIRLLEAQFNEIQSQIRHQTIELGQATTYRNKIIKRLLDITDLLEKKKSPKSSPPQEAHPPQIKQIVIGDKNLTTARGNINVRFEQDPQV